MKYSNPRTYSLIICTMFCILCMYSFTFAQDFNIGFGTSIYNGESFIFHSRKDLYLSMDFNNKWRIEPKINLYYRKYIRHRISRSRPRDESITSTSPIFECGFFRKWDDGNRLSMYTGLRIGFSYSYNYQKISIKPVVIEITAVKETSRYIYTFAPAFGIEHRFIKHLSLGCEANINYVYTTDPLINDETGHSESYDNTHSISTQLLIHLRWYWK